MRDYGRVHTSFWSSLTMRSLSEDGRMLALYLLTSPHSTISGVFRLPDGYACEDLSWSSERVKEGFAELLEKGFANRCETTQWVYIRKHFEWNRPENPNQRKAAKRVALMVPDECTWKLEFMRDWRDFLQITEDEFPNPSETVKEQLPQEQEQEQEYTSADAEGSGSAASAPRVPPCPHQEIIDLYHELLPMGTQVRVWNSTRAKTLQARWREDPKRQNLDWWRRFFAYVAESDFLTGRVPAAPGRDPFVVSLDWLVSPQNFAKTIEGRYENRSVA